jgi:hypothetical protein
MPPSRFKPLQSKANEGERVCVLMEEKGWTSKRAFAHVGISPRTFWDWVQTDSAFRERYERARISQAHYIAEEAIDIADEEAWTMEQVQRARNRVDTRKWYVSKIAPRIFGDRIEHAHTHRHAVVVLPAIAHDAHAHVTQDDAARTLDAHLRARTIVLPAEIAALEDASDSSRETDSRELESVSDS